MPKSPSTSISPRHASEQFADDPLIIQTAIECGVQTVTVEAELPESLRYLKDHLPGLLFWHHPVGGGDPVPQFRPDAPIKNLETGKEMKYIFPTDSGSVLSIAPSIQARLDADTDRESSILIVEGTKQNIFASTYTPENTIPVGIQGCWGWRSDGQSLPVIDSLVQGRPVYVAFDADISSNPKVYQAAGDFLTLLKTSGAKSVKFVKVPGPKNTGLDDFLATREAENRATLTLGMIKEAVLFSKIKKPPRVAALNTVGETFDYISEELGEVVEAVFESIEDDGRVPKEQQGLAIAGEINGRKVRRVTTLLTAAPRITTVVVIVDDLTPGSEPTLAYDITLQVGSKSDATFHSVPRVASGDLNKVRVWLDRAGEAGGSVSIGRGAQTGNGQIRIAEVMRDLMKNTDVERNTILRRTGWYEDDGVAYWVDNGGAHGANGKVDTIKSDIEGSLSSINIPDAMTFTKEQVVESVKAILRVCDYLHDPTPFVCMIAGTYWALCGGHPDAVLYITGGKGAGKSSISGVVSSIFGPDWGTGLSPMAAIEGTEASLSDIADQVHNCPIIIDDARQRSSSKAQESQDDAIDKIMRVGYGGGGAARTRKVADATGNWTKSKPRLNRPFVVIVGEGLPTTAPESTIERCLAVDVKSSTSLKSATESPDGVSGLHHLSEISRLGTFRPAVAWFIHNQAKGVTRRLSDAADGKIEHINSINEIREELGRARAAYTEWALGKYWPLDTPASERVRNVTGTFIAGVRIFMEQLMDLEVLPPEEIEAVKDLWYRLVIAAAVEHTSSNLQNESGIMEVLNQARGIISMSKHCIGEPNNNQTCIGQEITVDGSIGAIAFNPRALAEITRTSVKVLTRILNDSLIKDGNNPKRNAKINGTVMRSFVLPIELWRVPQHNSDPVNDEAASNDSDF